MALVIVIVCICAVSITLIAVFYKGAQCDQISRSMIQSMSIDLIKRIEQGPISSEELVDFGWKITTQDLEKIQLSDDYNIESLIARYSDDPHFRDPRIYYSALQKDSNTLTNFLILHIDSHVSCEADVSGNWILVREVVVP